VIEPRQILVVDDDQTVVMMLVAFLEDEGHRVWRAADGAEALRVLADHPEIEFAIIDIRLPDMEGNDLVLNVHARQHDLRFLIHTGSANYVLPPELIEIGIGPDDVLRKPLTDMEEILIAISRLQPRGE
jgi:CheY-like chemotaxis protein